LTGRHISSGCMTARLQPRVVVMADVFSIAKRSAVMSRIRSKGNVETELEMIRIFREHGITGWRRNQTLPGRPDFVFPELRLALFVDGCFWHGCPQHGTLPKGNRDYWRPKLKRNYQRDVEVNQELRRRRWHILRVWHHELARRNESVLLRKLKKALMIAKASRHGGGSPASRSHSRR
jgi:DNA mismatch endonuclease (patch repair protein)